MEHTVYVWHGISEEVTSKWPTDLFGSLRKVSERKPEFDVVVIDPAGLSDINHLPCEKLKAWKKDFVLYLPTNDLVTIPLNWCEHTLALFAAIVPEGNWQALYQATCPRQKREDWLEIASDSITNKKELLAKGPLDLCLKDFSLESDLYQHLASCHACTERFLYAARQHITRDLLGDLEETLFDLLSRELGSKENQKKQDSPFMPGNRKDVPRA